MKVVQSYKYTSPSAIDSKAIRALGRGYRILCIAPKALIVYSTVAYIVK